ncbi:putative ATP-dependent zinc metalloprotease YME1 like protein [Fusarium oxysporum f. sp. albedinis]|nr:putative ATP-dependent zinc metalloprotease YME1 like protein [Fusarium oxysporum f. sp. albedinis]
MPIGQRKVRRFACWQGVYSPLEAIGSEVGARLELCGGKLVRSRQGRLTKFEDQLSMEIGGRVPVEVLASDPPANLAPLHRGREH